MRQLRTFVCLASLLLLSAAASAQQDVINTFAGGGPNSVAATSANVYGPVSVATDSSGNYYFSTGNWPQQRVFKVNASGTLTVLAGTGFYGDSGDGGHAPQADLSPWGVAADSSGNVYIADPENCVIRKVDTTGTISTFAGTPPVAGSPQCGYGGDTGPATSAQLNEPYSVAVDRAGNVFIADNQNYRIREVTLDGNINTVAGTGTWCEGGGTSCGDGGTATSAEVSNVHSLAVDGSGNVYIADFYNYSVRKFSVGGSITTVAGNGTYCWGPGSFCGDGGLATKAGLSYVYAIAVDSPGNIFIADYENFRIREVTVSNSMINTVAGDGTGCGGGGVVCGDGGPAAAAGLGYVFGVAVDSSDDIFIADLANNAIREVTNTNGTTNPVIGNINTVAGNGYTLFSGNGFAAANATLNFPTAATSDSAGNIYIADQSNCVVREVIATTGNIATIAGTPGICGYNGENIPATSAQLNYPTKVAVYARNVYIADKVNSVIWQVDATGNITTFAGTPGVWGYGGDGGAATSAYLNGPQGVAVDSSGNVYIADTGNSVVRKVSGGIINTVAGNGGLGYWGDGGPATSAYLYSPSDVAVDASGNFYIADSENMRIRMVNTAGIISTVAGNGSAGYSGDGGPATAASLDYPFGVAVDVAGDVLIADTFNQRIRWVDGTGNIYTVAGDSFYGFSGDAGLATGAELADPEGVGVDPSGNIYIADSANQRVRMVNAVAGLNASTTNVTFGPQKIRTASISQPVTLSAVGPLNISSIVVTGDFSQSGNCVPGAMSGQCVMNIVFKPTATGTRTGTITISDNGYFSPSLVINLRGTGSSVSASLSPTTLVFAAQDGGTTSAAKTVTLTNYLSSPLSITSASISGTNAGDFAIAPMSTCGTSLGPTPSSCTYNITFTPSVNGAESATLSVSDADGTQMATLKGTSIGATLAPTSLTFAAQDGGTTSAAKTLALTNYLSSALAISVSFGGTNPGDFAVSGGTCPYPSGNVGASSNCTYTITFRPSVNGAESATLSVSDADGTQMATLKGTGIGATLAPTTLTFAAQHGSAPSAAKTLTLTNYLSSPLSISATLGGANPSDFTVQASSSCPYPSGSLGANSFCTYNITFTPSVNGAESALLTVIEGDGTPTVTLKGTGIGAAIAPTTLTFAAQTKGTPSAAKTLTFNNYLSTSLGISVSFGSANPGDFAVSGGTCPYPSGAVGANSSCTYNITFTPSVTGAESAAFSATDADGTQTVTVTGTGIGAPFPPNPGNTYYMRADGTAANKTEATGPCTVAADTMSVATHNSQTFSAGDTIILCDKGGVYRATLTPRSGGSAGSPITYTNSGSPSISGSDVETGWTLYDSTTHVYDISLATAPNVVIFDGTLGTKEASVGALTADGQWYYDSGGKLLHIYSATDPSGRTIEAGQRNNGVTTSSKSYITFQNFGVYGTNSNCFSVNYGTYVTFSGLTIYDCSPGNSAQGLLVNGSTYATVSGVVVHDVGGMSNGLGIYFHGNSGGNPDNGTITNTVVYNTGVGYDIVGYSSGSRMQNFTMTNSSAYACGNGISVSGVGSGTITQSKFYNNTGAGDGYYSSNVDVIGSSGVTFDHCSIYGATSEGVDFYGAASSNIIFRYCSIYNNGANGVSVGLAGCSSNSFYYNVLYGNTTSGKYALNLRGSGLVVENNTLYNNANGVDISNSDASSATVENNIFSTDATKHIVVVSGVTGFTCDYNLYGDDTGTRFSWAGSSYNFADWKSHSSMDAHSPTPADPEFFNTSLPDFHVKLTSPAINAGTNVSLTQDYYGNPVVGTPTIGAAQF
jgi:hypothetical protein